MIEISEPEKIDIANEIGRLEAMYKHYKILHRKLMLLCCSNERKVAKHKRDHFEHKLKQMRRLSGYFLKIFLNKQSTGNSIKVLYLSVLMK